MSEVECCIQGYHVYHKIWDAAVGGGSAASKKLTTPWFGMQLQARRQGGFEGVCSNLPFWAPIKIYTLPSNI